MRTTTGELIGHFLTERIPDGPTSEATGSTGELSDVAVRLALWAIVVGSALIRLAYVAGWQPPLTWDAALYVAAARRLLHSGYFAYGGGALAAHPNAVTLPGYTLLVSGVFGLFGSGAEGLLALRLLQAAMSVAIVLVVYFIGRRVASRRIALVAAAVAAVYPPFIWDVTDVMTETLYTLLFAAIVWLALECLDHPGARRVFALGLLAGVAAMVRSTGILWSVAPLVLLLLRGSISRRDFGRYATLLVLGVVLVMAPWWVRNCISLGRFVPFNTTSANPVLVATYWPNRLPTDVSIWPTSPSGDEVALNAEWRQRALARLAEQIATDPVGLLSRRVSALAWAVFEPYRLLRTRWFQPLAPTMSAYNLFARSLHIVLLFLAAVGVFLRRRDVRVLLLASAAVYVVTVNTAVLALPRYLFPATPVMIVLAGVGLAEVLWRVRDRLTGRATAAQAPVA